MNVSDSERMVNLLIQDGWEPTDSPETANLIIFNTCSVRQHAADRAISNFGALKKLKDKKFIFAGCVAKEKEDEMFKRFPHLDALVGPEAIGDIVSVAKRIFSGEKVLATGFLSYPEFSSSFTAYRLPLTAAVSRFVTIMRGCNNFCSYCIVPHVRGREIYRPKKNIIDEIKYLVASGAKEVTLLGQNVNSYPCFPQLLEDLNKISGLLRIRFMTSHPKDLSDTLIFAMRDMEKVMEHLHLPLQSGSDRILKAMNRHYTRKDYLSLIEKAKKEVPCISFTTDLIIGYPGETDKDFRDTLKTVKEVRFDGAFSFKYSPRPFTKALEATGAVPEEIKTERLDILNRLTKKTAEENKKQKIGKVLEVLSEKKDSGRSRENFQVFFNPETGPGELLKVKITSASAWSLKGKIISG